MNGTEADFIDPTIRDAILDDRAAARARNMAVHRAYVPPADVARRAPRKPRVRFHVSFIACAMISLAIGIAWGVLT